MPRDGIAARSEIPADGGEGGISGCPLQAASSNVVISQVYGGGGNFWSDLSKRFHRIVQPGEFYRECVWPVGAVCLLLGHDLARDNTESRIYRNTRVGKARSTFWNHGCRSNSNPDLASARPTILLWRGSIAGLA
jgi:hypothetical protein